MFCWIYKLIKKDATNDDMVYIGSTCDVEDRRYNHKNCCSNPNTKEHNLKVYKYIRENGGIDEWELIILDEFEVPLKECEERDKYEDNYIRKYDAINKLNKSYNIRSKKEYYEDNADIIKEKKKIYNKNNRDIINEKAKEYQKKNTDIIKERKNEYYKNNRDIINEKRKEYYKNNTDIIKERRKEKIGCDICGLIVSKCDIRKHQRTQKCINFKNLTI
jgi:hypothetical protein